MVSNKLLTFASQNIVALKNNIMNNIDSNTGEIVMYQPDETIRLEVRVENETVWLTQQQISDLFLRDRTVINRHINNVFKEGECDKESNVHFLHIPNIYDQGELKEEATVRKIRTVQKEGKRMVTRTITYYNLDTIISVGFRVNTKRGIEFRQWANSVLKAYLLRGYAINQQIAQIEQRSDRRFEIQEARISASELLNNIR